MQALALSKDPVLQLPRQAVFNRIDAIDSMGQVYVSFDLQVQINDTWVAHPDPKQKTKVISGATKGDGLDQHITDLITAFAIFIGNYCTADKF